MMIAVAKKQLKTDREVYVEAETFVPMFMSLNRTWKNNTINASWSFTSLTNRDVEDLAFQRILSENLQGEEIIEAELDTPNRETLAAKLQKLHDTITKEDYSWCVNASFPSRNIEILNGAVHVGYAYPEDCEKITDTEISKIYESLVLDHRLPELQVPKPRPKVSR